MNDDEERAKSVDRGRNMSFTPPSCGSSTTALVNVAYSRDDGDVHQPRNDHRYDLLEQPKQEPCQKQAPCQEQFAGDEASIQTMIQSKQKELQEMSEYQISILQQQAQEKNTALAAAEEKLERLRGDFTFNLALIAERDADLAQCEAAMAALQGGMHGKELALSDAKLSLAEAAQLLDAERHRHAEKEAQLLGRGKEARDDAAAQRWAKDEVERAARLEAETLKRGLATATLERDELFEHERAELVAAYESKLRCGEAMATERMEDLTVLLKAAEARAAELSRQKERMAVAAAELERRLADADARGADAGAAHRERAYELDEARRVAESRADEVEAQRAEERQAYIRNRVALEAKIGDLGAAVAASQRAAAQSQQAAAAAVARQSEVTEEGLAALRREATQAIERCRDTAIRAEAAEAEASSLRLREEEVALRHQAAVDKAAQQGRDEGADAADAALTEARILRQELREKNAALVTLSAKSALDAAAASEQLHALTVELRVAKQNQREHIQNEDGALVLTSTPPPCRMVGDTLHSDDNTREVGWGETKRKRETELGGQQLLPLPLLAVASMEDYDEDGFFFISPPRRPAGLNTADLSVGEEETGWAQPLKDSSQAMGVDTFAAAGNGTMAGDFAQIDNNGDSEFKNEEDNNHDDGDYYGQFEFCNLQKENTRLRSVVAAMSGELQKLHIDAKRTAAASAAAASSCSSSSSSSSSSPSRLCSSSVLSLSTRLGHSDAHNVVLQKRLEFLLSSVSCAPSQEQRGQELKLAHEEVILLRMRVAELEKTSEWLRAERVVLRRKANHSSHGEERVEVAAALAAPLPIEKHHGGCSSSTTRSSTGSSSDAVVVAVTAPEKQSREELTQLREELASVSGERDRLMTISNQLKGHLSQVHFESTTFGPGGMACRSQRGSGAHGAWASVDIVSAPSSPSQLSTNPYAIEIRQEPGAMCFEGHHAVASAAGPFTARQMKELEEVLRGVASQNKALKKKLRRTAKAQELQQAQHRAELDVAEAEVAGLRVELGAVHDELRQLRGNKVGESWEGTGAFAEAVDGERQSGRGQPKQGQRCGTDTVAVAAIRLNLLRPAIRGLFSASGSDSDRDDGDEGPALDQDDIVSALAFDQNTARLLGLDTPNHARRVLSALGVTTAAPIGGGVKQEEGNDENEAVEPQRQEGVRVTYSQLIGLWNAHAAMSKGGGLVAAVEAHKTAIDAMAVGTQQQLQQQRQTMLGRRPTTGISFSSSLIPPLAANTGVSGSAQRADLATHSATRRTLQSQERVKAAIARQSTQRRSSIGAVDNTGARLISQAASARQRAVRNYNNLRPQPLVSSSSSSPEPEDEEEHNADGRVNSGVV